MYSVKTRKGRERDRRPKEVSEKLLALAAEKREARRQRRLRDNWKELDW